MVFFEKKIYSWVFMIALMVFPTVSISQSMLSYENKKDTSKSQKELNWETLKGDMSLNFWCTTTQKNNFLSNDLNDDKVLSIRDLGIYDKSQAKQWSVELLNRLFTFWAPDYDSHIEEVKEELSSIVDKHPDLSIIKQAPKSYKKVTQDIKLNDLSSKNVFIKTNSGKAEILNEGFTDTGRKWVTVNVPINITIYNGDINRDYSLNIIMNLIRKYKYHEFDSKFALIEMGLN